MIHLFQNVFKKKTRSGDASSSTKMERESDRRTRNLGRLFNRRKSRERRKPEPAPKPD